MKRKLLFPLVLLCLLTVFNGCAGQSAQQTAGNTLLAMHDLVLTSATSANTLCEQKTISAADCAKIKKAYEDFRLSWPIVDDALIVYLKAPATDSNAATAFNVANSVFIQHYTDLISLFTTTGVLKGAK